MEVNTGHRVWFHKGYSGNGCKELLETLSGRPAIVTGNAKGVFDEVSEASAKLGSMAVVFSANDSLVYMPVLHHAVSLHASKLVHWTALRRDNYSRQAGNKDFEIHDAGHYGKRDWHQWTGLTPVFSLSGMFACQVAYLMGCSPIVLTGCPADNTPRFWETECTNPAYREAQEVIRQEMAFKPEFRSVVRSTSGWTKEYFGAL